MDPSLATVLMFEGTADAALALYQRAFPTLKADPVERYGPGEGGRPGKVKRASWTLGGQRFIAFDSAVTHGFAFTPAVSILVECDAETVDRTAALLCEGGRMLMPPGKYDFADRFAWVEDRFGVSWQLASAVHRTVTNPT